MEGPVGGPRVVANSLVSGCQPDRGRRERLLQPISFVLEPGTVLRLTGPNGSGKTTLMRTVFGLGRIRAGHLSIDGRPPGEYRRRSGIGFAPADPSLPPGWTAADFVTESARLRRRSWLAGAVAAEDVLHRLDLDQVAKLTTEHLSSGWARLTSIAFAAISGAGGLLLLDEPWAQVDDEGRDRLLGLLLALRRDHTTIVFTSHQSGVGNTLVDQSVALSGAQ